MKRNLKKAAALGLVPLFALGMLSGCGQSSQQSGSTAEASAENDSSEAVQSVAEEESSDSEASADSSTATDGDASLVDTLAEVALGKTKTKENITQSVETGLELPATFDLREFPTADGSTINVVGSVKLQSPWGSCWSFGTISACESSLMSQFGIDRYSEDAIDLSELHLAYFAADYVQDNDDGQLNEGVHFADDTDTAARLNNGGGADITASVLSNGVGPVPEEAAPYENSTGAKEVNADGTEVNYAAEPSDGWNVDQSLKYETYAELENANYLPSPAGADEAAVYAVKSELMKGKGVSIGYFADQSQPGESGNGTYFNYSTWSQCVDEPTAANHEVCIVGWDDNYSRENFAEGHLPEGDGAWIVKNSWGAEVDTDGSDIAFPNNHAWGIVDETTGKHTGYFYLSYYDQSIDEAETYDFSSLSDEDEYQYEVMGYDQMPYDTARYVNVSSTDLNAESLKTANVFKNDSGKTLELRKVSYTNSLPNSTVDWEIYVYDGNESDAVSVLTSQKPVATAEKEFTYRGFHRVDMEQPVEIAPDQYAIIAVTEKNDVGSVFGIAVGVGQDDAAANNLTSYTVGICNEGESLISIDGEWVDWHDVTEKMKDLTEASEGSREIYAYDNIKIKGYATYK